MGLSGGVHNHRADIGRLSHGGTSECPAPQLSMGCLGQHVARAGEPGHSRPIRCADGEDLQTGTANIRQLKEIAQLRAPRPWPKSRSLTGSAKGERKRTFGSGPRSVINSPLDWRIVKRPTRFCRLITPAFVPNIAVLFCKRHRWSRRLRTCGHPAGIRTAASRTMNSTLPRIAIFAS